MQIIFLLIGCSIFIALIFLAAFLWSVKSGQYDDTYSPAVRILFEDSTVEKNEEPTSTEDEAKKDQN